MLLIPKEIMVRICRFIRFLSKSEDILLHENTNSVSGVHNFKSDNYSKYFQFLHVHIPSSTTYSLSVIFFTKGTLHIYST